MAGAGGEEAAQEVSKPRTTDVRCSGEEPEAARVVCRAIWRGS